MCVPMLEICVDSLASAREAALGGADRLEVCSNLLIGGTTPSPALVRAIVRETALPVRALIRPRAGDFLYTHDECDQMCEEIRSLVQAGAQGVVIGSLNADGTLNEAHMRAMIDSAQRARITLHRAFDMCCDPFACMETAIELGVDTILTSGGEDSVRAGKELLEALVKQSGGRVQILAGGGVDAQAIEEIYPLGVRAFHLSGKRTVESGMIFRNPRVHMGACGMSEYEAFQTDAGRVRAAKESLCLAFLREALPMQDRLDVPRATLESIVRASLDAYQALPFAREADPAMFYTYVLMPRVNDERLDDTRAALLEALKPRVQGLDSVHAALAVNNWCAQHVRYASTDGRTRGVRGILNACEGRCGEESVFTVNALRAVGLPARQVYALWWSHCDDNHAWVEVYAQGAWHYIGACEPEEALDRGWFTSAASRAMLIHTRAFGHLTQEADAFYTRGCYTGVNRTHAYADTVRLNVRVQDGGQAQVRFMLANSGRLRTLYAHKTDANGCVTLETRRGGLYVCVRWPDGKMAARVVDTQKETEVCFSREDGVERTFYLRAPQQSRMGQESPGALCSACARAYEENRTKVCQDAEKLAADHPSLSSALENARGNAQALYAFYAQGENQPARAALLSALGEKDCTDVDIAVLEDALAAGVTQLRRGTEQLYPVYGGIRRFFAERTAPQTMEEIVDYLRTQVREEETIGLDWPCRTDAALEAGRCAAGGRETMAWHIASALGITPPEPARKVRVTFSNLAGLRPQENFALVRVDEGQRFTEITLDPAQNQAEVLPGRYVLFVLSRQLDGSVYGHFEEIELSDDCDITLVPERDDTRALLRRVPLPEWAQMDEPEADVIAFLVPGEEPTAHFLNELLNEKTDVRFLLLVRGGTSEALVTRAAALEQVCVRPMGEREEAALVALRTRMGVGDARLPFAVALSPSGEGVYACANYEVGSVARLADVVRIARS